MKKFRAILSLCLGGLAIAILSVITAVVVIVSAVLAFSCTGLISVWKKLKNFLAREAGVFKKTPAKRKGKVVSLGGTIRAKSSASNEPKK